jgi:hypothetical protein
MPLITFTNKADSRIIDVPAINKIVASDINSLKDGINANETDIATTVIRTTGDQTIAGTLNATNISGTNTGDQDLSGLQLKSEKDAVSGYAGLDGSGKINPSQLPALAITDTFVVASQSAMLALTAQVGDIAVRTDVGQTFILKTDGSTVLVNWQQLQTPTDAVSSVFGRVGVVTAQNNDYTFAQINKSTSSLADITTRNFSDLQNKPTTISGYGITDVYNKTESDGKYLLNTTDTLTGDLTVTGDVKIGANKFLKGRNAADTTDILLIGLDSNNKVKIDANGLGTLISSDLTVGNDLEVDGELSVTQAATFASSVSATDGNFSGKLGVGGVTPSRQFEVQSDGGIVGVLTSTTAGSYITMEDNSTTSDSQVRYGAIGNKGIMYSGGSIALTLETDQSATFASSVSATSLQLNGTNEFNILSNNDGGNLFLNSSSRGFVFRNGNGNLLSMAASGAATFSSSVSATKLEINTIRETGIKLSSTDTSAVTDELLSGVDFYSPDSGNEGIKASIKVNYADASANSYMTLNSGSNTESLRLNADNSATFASSVSATDGLFSGQTFFGTTGTPNGTSVFGSAFTSASSNKMILEMASSSTVAGNLLVFYNPNGAVGNIQISGSSTSFNTSSDYRLKEDLKDFNGLEMISNIPVYNHKWKVDNSRSYSVLAHELQEVLPQAVSGEKDAEEMQGVDYSKIVPLLIKSIQELTAKVELLENK